MWYPQSEAPNTTIPKNDEEDDEKPEEIDSKTTISSHYDWGDIILDTPVTYVQFKTDKDDMDKDEDELITHWHWRAPSGKKQAKIKGNEQNHHQT